MQVRARCAQEKTGELTFPSVASTAQLYALFPWSSCQPREIRVTILLLDIMKTKLKEIK